MIIVMTLEASPEQIEAVCQVIRDHALDPLVLPGENRTAIGIPAYLDNDQRVNLESVIERLPGVSKVTQTSRPYKLASSEYNRVPLAIEVPPAKIGPGTFTVMGGPCSIESYDQLTEAAKVVKATGATVLRGGAFKPRTSPYSFQGLAVEGLKIMKQVGREQGLATVTEVMSGEMVETVAEYVDILQIGARSMQNFPLLIEAGRSKRPVFLKRGPGSTIDEFLLAAEYVLNEGNPNVILCERGVLPLDRSYTRNTLDLSCVCVLKQYSHLPVIVDPSHGTGVARYVLPMAKAAAIVGADGVMVEMHPSPSTALSDGSQALNATEFTIAMAELKKLTDYCGLRWA